MNILHDALHTFRRDGELDNEELPMVFDALMAETDEAHLATILEVWTKRGVSENELFGMASIMRTRCTRIASPHDKFVDIVGTGGSMVKTFNVSTAAAFVIAGSGVAVAKHGNRAASSATGSADVLSQLGVGHAVDADTASRCLAEIGICFMFAPNFHRLSPVLGKVRRGLGFPTVFNVLGPLCNPADAPHHVIGVSDPSILTTVANVLARLGTERSWIVNGTDGLDEITLNGETRVVEVKGRELREFTLDPGSFGVGRSSMEGLKASSPVESADIVRRVLNGSEKGRAAESVVLINAAAAIHLASDMSLNEAFISAKDSISDGSASRKLSQLAAMTNDR